MRGAGAGGGGRDPPPAAGFASGGRRTPSGLESRGGRRDAQATGPHADVTTAMARACPRPVPPAPWPREALGAGGRRPGPRWGRAFRQRAAPAGAARGARHCGGGLRGGGRGALGPLSLRPLIFAGATHAVLSVLHLRAEHPIPDRRFQPVTHQRALAHPGKRARRGQRKRRGPAQTSPSGAARWRQKCLGAPRRHDVPAGLARAPRHTRP